MKAKLTTVLAVTFTIAVVVVAVAVVAAVAVAPAGATQLISTHAVTADPVAETSPDLVGSNLVWQQKTGSDWNIYYSDGLPGTVAAICTDPGDQILPRVSVSGGHTLVVWEDHRNGNADIYGYDVTAGKAFTVCSEASQQVAPRISGDWVVWQDKRNGNWDIYGATIDPSDDSVGAAAPICIQGSDQTEPDVSGDTVVWVDTRYGDQDIMGYNGQAAVTFPICLNDAVQDQPAVSGDTVVWRDARNAATSGDRHLRLRPAHQPRVRRLHGGRRPELAGHRPGPRRVERRALGGRAASTCAATTSPCSRSSRSSRRGLAGPADGLRLPGRVDRRAQRRNRPLGRHSHAVERGHLRSTTARPGRAARRPLWRCSPRARPASSRR